jgi:hypothetical protein
MGELDKASLVINIDLATRVRFPHPVTPTTRIV